MYIGQFLPQSTGSPLLELFTSWFPRGGDGAYLTVQVIQKQDVSPVPDLQVRVYHRAKNGTGSGTEIPTTWSAEDANGYMTCDLQADAGSPQFGGFLELVRFSFVALNGDLIYRVLPPVWVNLKTAAS